MPFRVSGGYVGETLDQPPPIFHFSLLRGYLKLPETSLIVIPAKAHGRQLRMIYS